MSAEISMADRAITRTDLFLRACRCEPVPRAPVWMMRQAGRYLPQYREIRKKHPFLEVAKTPELAAEVSLQPFRQLGVDAVIVFSDILIASEAMGLPLELNDGGPVLPEPIRTEAQVARLRDFDPEVETRFVCDAIRLLRRELGPDIPVIGFAAAPWTLACYMVDGRGREGFPATKTMMFSEPQLFRRLLAQIASATAKYLRAQIAAGATAVQLFDTWAGELSAEDYATFELPATQQLISQIHAGATPVILYTKASGHFISQAARAGADVLSVDWRADLGELRRTLGPTIALQGNVDPCVLLGPQNIIEAAVINAISQTDGRGHIVNLGHGILPNTPVENAQKFIRAAQKYRTASAEVSPSAKPPQG